MPMFGDLNKLNTKQEKPKQEPQQQLKHSATAAPVMPSESTPAQNSTETLSYEQPELSQQHRSNVRTNERTSERTRVRHSFDIFNDQLMSLREIALSRQMLFGKKTLLGDLVQEALDFFITKERNKEERTNVRSNEHPNERLALHNKLNPLDKQNTIILC